MPPDQNQPQPPEERPKFPILSRRPMRDPRLGFRRQFVSTQSLIPGGSGQAESPTPAERMGRQLYDDPYYQSVPKPDGRSRKGKLVLIIVIIFLLTVGSAFAFQMMRKSGTGY